MNLRQAFQGAAILIGVFAFLFLIFQLGVFCTAERIPAKIVSFETFTVDGAELSRPIFEFSSKEGAEYRASTGTIPQSYQIGDSVDIILYGSDAKLATLGSFILPPTSILCLSVIFLLASVLISKLNKSS